MKESIKVALEKALEQTLNRISEKGPSVADNDFIKIANNMLGVNKKSTQGQVMNQVLPTLMQNMMGGNTGGVPPMNNMLGGGM